MFLGKVIGTVVASKRYKDLHRVKFLIVQPLDHRHTPCNDPLVAVDTMRAGLGELVFLEDGREASFTLPNTFVPIDAAVVGIVDSVDVVDGKGYTKSQNT